MYIINWLLNLFGMVGISKTEYQQLLHIKALPPPTPIEIPVYGPGYVEIPKKDKEVIDLKLNLYFKEGNSSIVFLRERGCKIETGRNVNEEGFINIIKDYCYLYVKDSVGSIDTESLKKVYRLKHSSTYSLQNDTKIFKIDLGFKQQD